jgi:type IV pilus assembly protein PilF
MRVAKFLTIFAAVMVLAACVSSTSGRPKTTANNDEAAQSYYQLGARYFRNVNYEFARDRLERAIALDPKNVLAQSTLALTYARLENPRLATEHYDQAVRLEPNNIDVRNAYAVFLCQQRRFDDASEQFQRGLRVPINDNREVMLTNAGVCMSQKPDLEQAESYFRQALDEKSGYGEALLQLALLKQNQGDNLAARAFLQRFLATNSATAQILYLGIKVESAIGDERASGEYAMRLLRDFPKSAESSYVREGR